jgi:methylmalonyl-CoA mutase cobalamin-binding subunit
VSTPTALRRARRSVVVLAGSGRTSERPARALAESRGRVDVETTYLGREESARRIATVVAEEQADAVEVCVAGGGGVLLLRALLRELTEIGRRDVSIVVHRVE